MDWTTDLGPSRCLKEAAWRLMNETGSLDGVAAMCRFVYSLRCGLR